MASAKLLKRSSLLVGALTAMVFATATNAGTILIDDFEQTNQSWPQTISSGASLSLSDTGVGVLGGDRGIDASVVGGDLTLSIDPSAGLLSYDSAPGADGQLTLSYSPSAADFSSGASFDVGFHSLSTVVAVSVGLIDSNGQSASVSGVASSAGLFTLPISEFLSQNPSLDVSAIDDIQVTLDAAAGGDFEVSSVTDMLIVLPTPTAAWAGLVLLGVMAGWKVRRGRHV